MSTPARFLTVEEFLAKEEQAEYKSEYYAGETFPMEGASANHSLINVQMTCIIGSHLRRCTHRIYGSDMLVRIAATGLLTYPDMSIVCGPSKVEGGPNHDRLLLNPDLLVEVLAPWTEAYDRGRKFEHYRTLPSLKQYVLIASDRVHADVFTRGENDLWILASASKPDDLMQLTAIDCTIRLGDLYEQTDLAEPAPPAV